ncbi:MULTISPECIES: crossover junction endodeoxyribonuclease RuvC [Anaerococcus]|uniref:Crossover junction endodeoxyribonuclease RuvC n=2 Tax=Anaerococcus TaxID=165779 RepID=A0A3E2TIK4_9FIRM|nr:MULTISPECIES: crossover junction endodeoxyribonuclease RuvC [Anaerococcus]MDU1863911.1 crossover junction endodeoxyribonuclease RuvC [Anaerococcus sp.]MDU2565619.1 crossover junction endodeoxyribonuclease RuvC [Anaerococcus sp.]RGB76520.1 crossover junction endodeoxyribonuclease RuvC [Anaerococcus nagyae]
MKILGIDPGIAIMGYGVVEFEANKVKVIENGVVTTSSKTTTPERLSILYKNLNEIIKEFKPDEFAIEELFFNQNVKTAITVGHARGIQILSAQENNLPIYEYTPLQIKQAITGYGRANKSQMQKTVTTLLNLKEIPKPDDAADALSVALCHALSQRFKENFRMN